MLRVLVVEDTRERQEILTSLYRDHAWILVHTVARARRLLDAYDFDVASLDYNLAGPGDGCDVARHLVVSRNARVRVVIHSMNPLGRERLLEIVPDAVVMPVDRIVRSNRELRRLRVALVAGRDFDWS